MLFYFFPKSISNGLFPVLADCTLRLFNYVRLFF